MSRFYGQVEGLGKTTASRRGGDHIKASVQSWNGSVITRMHYDDDEKLILEISVCKDDSSFHGQSVFYGTIEELMDKLSEE